MRIVQSKLLSSVDVPAGLITNAMVNSAAAIDAGKIDLTLAKLLTAESAGTSVILTLTLCFGD